MYLTKVRFFLYLKALRCISYPHDAPHRTSCLFVQFKALVWGLFSPMPHSHGFHLSMLPALSNRNAFCERPVSLSPAASRALLYLFTTQKASPIHFAQLFYEQAHRHSFSFSISRSARQEAKLRLSRSSWRNSATTTPLISSSSFSQGGSSCLTSLSP